jgi:signal transduction histidine kinase
MRVVWSIRRRLTIFHAATILVIVTLLVTALVLVVIRAVQLGVEETARARALELARILDAGEMPSESDLARLSADGAFVIARDAEGQIVVKTANVPPDPGGNDQALWQEALASGEPVDDRISLPWLTDRSPTYVWAVPISPAGSPVRVVEGGRSFAGTGEDLVVFAPGIVIAAILAVAIAIAGSYLLARSALAPVEAITQSARQITGSDLSQRVPVKNRRDELGRLAMTFNDLLARLEVSFAQREDALAQQRRFVADAGHELRTPLTSILGFARMLRQWGLDHPEISREAVSAIEQEATRMGEMVDGLLDLARGDEGQPLALNLGLHDLRDVAREAVDAARASAEGKVTITYQPSSEPVMARVDRDRIYQIASILLDNAVKYTAAQGSVNVTTRPGAMVELEVADSGIGIAARHLPHVFERFYRVDEARSAGGSGLGLAIALQIAKAHGGTITVASDAGAGSTFTLRLPRDAERDQISDAAPANAPEV